MDGCVFRVPNAYPVYDSAYAGHLQVIREYLASLVNCQTVGRNGLHRYNNQDHSMLAAKKAVEAIVAGSSDKSAIWGVNIDDEYHEEAR